MWPAALHQDHFSDINNHAIPDEITIANLVLNLTLLPALVDLLQYLSSVYRHWF